MGIGPRVEVCRELVCSRLKSPDAMDNGWRLEGHNL